MSPAKPQIIAVGAEAAWRDQVRASFAGAQLELHEFASGAHALEQVQESTPDLLLTDMVLQDMTGLGLCRLLREDAELAAVPVIMLSRYSSEIDRVQAFEAGVDDYLAAPFYRRELVSRVQAVLRRSRRSQPAPGSSQVARIGPLVFDAARNLVEVDGRRVNLTRTEFEVLGSLIRHDGKVLSREQILDRTSNRRESRESERAVDAHVKSIRRKLGPARDFIETVRGAGYRFAARAASGMRSSPDRSAGLATPAA